MLSDPLFVISLLFLTFLPFLIIGRFTFKALRIEKFLTSNVAINIPVYGTTGFLVSLLFLNIIGLFTIGIASLVFFLIFTAFAFFILVRTGDVASLLSELKKITWSSLLKGAVPLSLIIFTFFHFSFVISIMGWPPVGDILANHGSFTSLLLYNGKIINTLEPLSSLQISYPIGFQVLAADIAYWFNLFPGEAVFLLGGLAIILIPVLMYSLTYTLTKSIPLSLLVYLSTFIIHPSLNLEMWVVGYFYNGPYPNLTAFMIIIFSIYILGLLEYGQPEILKQSLAIGSITILFLTFLTLLLVYPNFSIFVAIMIIFVILKHHKEFVIFIQKKPISTITPFVLLAGLTFLALPQSYIRSPTVALNFVSYTYTLTGVYAYALSPTFFPDYITAYVMFAAFLISLILLYKKRYLFINLIYITILCMVISTLSASALSILSIILPSRAIIIPAIVSWLILSLGITEIFTIRRLKRYSHPLINSAFVFIIVVSLILVPQFTSSIVQEFSYQQAQYWGWFARIPSFQNDFMASSWINYNVPPNDLILNGRSYSDFIILELSIKNLTFNWQLDQAGIARAKELKAIWEKPYDNNTVYQLLKKYDVCYVFVTSEWGYLNWPWLGENGTYSYLPKPFTPQQYDEIFDTYPFLKILFRSGLTTVYKVEFNSYSTYAFGLKNLEGVG